jgi:hypothetical protein
MTKPIPETHRVKRVVTETVRASTTEVASSSSVKQEHSEEPDLGTMRKQLAVQEKAIGSLIVAFKKMKPTLAGFSLSLTRAC